MDYVVPVILFAVGFTAFLFASRAWKWSLATRKGEGLALKDGTVRLDLVGKERSKEEAVPQETSPAGSPSHASRGGGSARKARTRGRR